MLLFVRNQKCGGCSGRTVAAECSEYIHLALIAVIVIEISSYKVIKIFFKKKVQVAKHLKLPSLDTLVFVKPSAY